jgi:uncharacterized membrane protein YedE/YeeE
VRARVAGALVGVIFGVVLCWSGMSDPDVIRRALLIQDAYLYGFFASAVGTAAIGLAVLRRSRPRAVLTDQTVEVPRERVERRHITGSVLFGVGWGIANACPGPVLTQVGMGVPWAVFTLAGMAGGVWLHQRRGNRDTEPACDATPARRVPAAA